MDKEVFEVKIKKREVNLIIWIIPIISLLVGGWLIYKYYSSLGPMITIKFQNSGGLEPKRSVVKFRDVSVGKVEKIKILRYGNGVLVYVRMNKEMKPFLNDLTKFWIVKPQIGLGEVRGLDALLSGPYIQMYAKPLKFTKTHFIGLNEPPLDSTILHGKIIKLISDSTYGLSEKLPVYFKQMKVGTIRKVEIMKNAKVKIIISINKKYAHFINDSTKFWNVQKIDISLIKNYLQVSIPSLKEIIFGGIVFATPNKNAELTKKVFKLYPSKAKAFANRLGNVHRYKEFLVKFNKENSFLNPGEPIEFKGFDVGFIEDVKSYFDFAKNQVISYAVLKIDVGAFGNDKNVVKKLLNKGLSVYIKTIPILNSATLHLTFTNKPYKYEMINGKIKLRAIYKKENSIIANLNKFIEKLNKLPLDKTIKNLNELLSSTKPALSKALYAVANTSNSINKLIKSKKMNLILININELIKNLNKTIKTYSNNSMFYKQISKTLYDVDKTMNNLNRVIIKIDKKPNSLILGD